MNKKILSIIIIISFVILSFSFATSLEINNSVSEDISKNSTLKTSDNEWYIQWIMNFGSDHRWGARYEGPQPVGDCNNDALNEWLIGGRDDLLRVMSWNEERKTYLQTHCIHNPFYPEERMDAGGFAIGDLTGDGKNEIAATWDATIYKWINGKYRVIGLNPWIFQNGGGNPDCYIGDYDNDGKNELIMSGGPLSEESNVPEIVVYGWNGIALVREAEWNDPDDKGYVYMAGMGDTDYDGLNEIVLGTDFKVIVLDWDKEKKEFTETVIEEDLYHSKSWPFACVCKDSDMDGKDEIHVGYHSPNITIFEYDGNKYVKKFEKYWPGELALIESMDVADADNDGVNEVCAGTDIVHILQWNGETYIEEATLPTYGTLAVLNVGDFDNDGLNELNTASVRISHGEDYMSWVFKYGQSPFDENYFEAEDGNCILEVTVKDSFGGNIGGGSILARNLKTGVWYDIEPYVEQAGPSDEYWGVYKRYDIPDGDYLIRSVMKGYKTKEIDLTISEGEQTNCVIDMQPKVKSINSLQKDFLITKILQRFTILKNILW